MRRTHRMPIGSHFIWNGQTEQTEHFVGGQHGSQVQGDVVDVLFEQVTFVAQNRLSAPARTG